MGPSTAESSPTSRGSASRALPDTSKKPARTCSPSPGFPKSTGGSFGPTTLNNARTGKIRRRTDVIGIFPTRPSVIRLVGAVMAELDDEWAIARRYLSLDSLAQARIRLIDPPHPQLDRKEHLLAALAATG